MGELIDEQIQVDEISLSVDFFFKSSRRKNGIFNHCDGA